MTRSIVDGPGPQVMPGLLVACTATAAWARPMAGFHFLSAFCFFILLFPFYSFCSFILIIISASIPHQLFYFLSELFSPYPKISERYLKRHRDHMFPYKQIVCNVVHAHFIIIVLFLCIF
jgi:hypothetical protein